MFRRGDYERLYQAQRAGTFRRLVMFEGLEALEAEGWISRWEREAGAKRIARGSMGFWDAGWRWIAENRRGQ